LRCSPTKSSQTTSSLGHHQNQGSDAYDEDNITVSGADLVRSR
jgi:hypothetical protein